MLGSRHEREALSPRQAEALLSIEEAGRTSLFVGAMRSGKSHIAARAFALLAMLAPPRSVSILAGRAPRVLAVEIVPHVLNEARRYGLEPTWNRSNQTLDLGGHTVVIAAYTDVKSADRIASLTAWCAFLDEAARCDEAFYDMVLSRLVFAGSKFLLAANPEGPTHWLKQRLDAGRIDHHFRFRLRDNPRWTDEEIALYEAQWPVGSVFYRRMILGQWAAATGLVFPGVLDAEADGGALRDGPPTERWRRNVAGGDFGLDAPTSVVVGECFHDDGSPMRIFVPEVNEQRSDKESQIAASAQAARIKAWHAGLATPFSTMFIDPSAALKHELREVDVPFAVVDADNSVRDGIMLLSRLFNTGRLTIADTDATAPLRDEIAGYVWDPRPSRQDVPLKQNDHSIDALRYLVAGIEAGSSSNFLRLVDGD